MSKDAIIGKIDLLLRQAEKARSLNSMRDEIEISAIAGELVAGTISLLEMCWGPDSNQVQSLLTRRKDLSAKYTNEGYTGSLISQEIAGILSNLKHEVLAGLLGSLKNRYSGEILSDFILLAREAAQEKEEGAKNVAAVLAAAAYEDTIRRMGTELAGIPNRPDLQNVIIELKEQNILEGPQVGIAQSYLKFRNDALHADWDKIERASIESILGFIEQLLLKHFG